ncbi:hypothetical protein ABEB36_002905 [Hypothenemus hampei]|uniref:ADAMTS-like protein 3 n=1 Tax=Hypothenemus hampei TaxID=57062 RepID=A0ABD1F7E4_HYPHA
MCIDGKCERVGCDLKLGSEKQVDECGICGGDGSSCAKPLYHWTLTFTSLCSSSCGGGYKMSRAVCQNRISGDEVEEDLCNDAQRPESSVVQCNLHECPAKWHVGEWGSCTVSCGNGFRERTVNCIVQVNGTVLTVDETKCAPNKPWLREACNQQDCPTWFKTKWSGCSVSCGEGIQTRFVECRDSKGRSSEFCEEKARPENTQVCSTGISCPFKIDASAEILPGLFQTNLVENPPPLKPEKLVADPAVPSESTFIPEEWGPCSVTCGEGIRRREVNCKIFLEFSRTIAKLPDERCTGTKPIEVEPCYRECTTERIEVDIKDDPSNIKVGSGSVARSYSWKEQGFTPCSASCLGGVQELIVNCVRDDSHKVTSPYMCPIDLKPEVIIRACNEHSCPPRWSYTEFSTCSQSCGIGIQTRDVNCIHELTQGGSNTVVVPNNRCPQPPPPDRQYCNVLDCPVRWKVSEWSKCSKPCGAGEKSRKVDCKQVMAQNHTVDRPHTMCPNPRPVDKKPCNTKSCVIESDKPQISVTNSTFIQHDPKKNKITLKVGGAATLFTGTTVKIKCPVKRFDRTKIVWKKDNVLLPQNRKFKGSKKGALRIQNLTLRDRGTYTCLAGKSSAGITISVRQKPGEFPTSEEIQKHMKMDVISEVNGGNQEDKPNYADDQSHEQKPDKAKKQHKFFTPTSSSSSLTLDVYMKPTMNEDSDSKMQENSGKRRQDKVTNLSPSPMPSNAPNYGDSRSSASRIMPNFLSLISKIQEFWPFQKSSSSNHQSRDYRMVTFPINPQQIPPTDLMMASATLPSRLHDDEVVLGKGPEKSLKFRWKLSDWTECSESCGGQGFQTRVARCFVHLNNETQKTDGHLCEDAGISMPQIRRMCGFEKCPQWTVSDWSSCDKSKCFSLHKAIQRRLVKCQIAPNLTLSNDKCPFDEKPEERRECNKLACVGKWKVSSWSMCNAACDQQGEKYRTFHCVWYGTKKPAGDACKDLPRPIVRKFCKGPPCETSTQGNSCKDLSMFCGNVKSLNLCKRVKYRQQCCQTCKDELLN